MKSTYSVTNICTGFAIFLILIGNCSAAPQNPDISGIGQVVWQEIEGGFYGIVTPDGTQYLPLNLPESYKVNGVTVDLTGTLSDLATLQMWGKPIEIQTIKPVNRDNPFLHPWYSPAGPNSSSTNETMAEHLIMAASGLQIGLDSMDRQVSSIAKNITRNGSEQEDIKNLLFQGLTIPGVYEVTYMDMTGRITAAVPEEFDRFVGYDVSDQDINSRTLSYPSPGMSEYFTTIEGKDAVILTYPVFSADRTFTGAISVLFDPANLTEIYSIPYLNGTHYDLMVSQPDGKILYDGHPGMNGQGIWNNTEFTKFPDLLSWAAHFQNAQSGTDQYSYYLGSSGEIGEANVIWTTVALHGTPWRIFMISR